MSYVVGTAGHIDHGKSTLIHALTGIDPDRLAEEKRRGMTIDLGFAHLALPSGREIGIVDVPGHARFVHNMLAGVHGLDAVLLVVAADEGVMPQTREHLEIVDLLRVSRGLAVLTKADLVEPDWLDLVAAEVVDALRATSLADAEVVPVSAVTGAGLDQLTAKLDALLAATPPRADAGRARLPVDRVFTIAGFGTVVTGTLVDGSVAAGDELELLPAGRRIRVRGLQVHGRQVERAGPGTRVAVNVAGVERDDLRRGDVLASPATLTVTRRADARVRVPGSGDSRLRHGERVLLHAGTAEVPSRVIALDDPGWIQLYLDRPLAAAPGDRFVLRRPSPPVTLAGGELVDLNPRKHARHDASAVASLERRAAGEVLQEELAKYPRGVTAEALLKASLAPEADLDTVRVRRAGRWLFAPDAWDALRRRAEKMLAEYHRAQPLRPGMPREELQSRLGLLPAAFGAVLRELAAEGVLAERDGIAALPGHAVELGAGSGPAARLLELLRAEPFAPPSLAEATRESGAGPELVRALERSGDIVRLSPDVAFTQDAYQRAVDKVRAVVQADGQVTVARLRDELGASRRPILALLEHLDAQRITRRVGDARVLR
jgi:selenocysteine-specific elongation factor